MQDLKSSMDAGNKGRSDSLASSNMFTIRDSEREEVRILEECGNSIANQFLKDIGDQFGIKTGHTVFSSHDSPILKKQMTS